MVPQQYCLRWKHHHSNVQNMFAQLLEKERFCDVTLYCSPSFATQVTSRDTVDPESIRGVSLRAHRVVLAACSELLGTLLGAHESQGEPVLVIDGAEPKHVRALLDYMYTGEMNVHHSQLASLLKTAEELRIKGLTDIRWNNKDEPPDCHTGAVTTTSTSTDRRKKSPELILPDRNRRNDVPDSLLIERDVKREDDLEEFRHTEKINNVNGGPPPLIKLPTRMSDLKTSALKRETSDNDSLSPKRRRMPSVEHSDEDDKEWQHGSMDITAERIVGWCGETGVGGSTEGKGGGAELQDSTAASWDGDPSDDEWADAPADIGSFLHTRLRVDGDNSADDESNEEAAPSTSSSAGTSAVDIKVDSSKLSKSVTSGPKSGPTDPRFTDVVKLNDYLKHGRRPQFWEEHYVKRVMEAVRVKELEMKQAAEILGVSYGTLYGRYRDVFGCINRPYRTARDFWQAKGPAEVLERLQRGEMSLDAGAVALGVSTSNLASYMADLNATHEKEFEPIPIEVDPSLKKMTAPLTSGSSGVVKMMRKNFNQYEKKKPSLSVTSATDEEPIPASVIKMYEREEKLAASSSHSSGAKWPSIRVASIDSLRGSDPASSPSTAATPPAPPASPSHLMRTRPDLTIVAAKKQDSRNEDNEDS